MAAKWDKLNAFKRDRDVSVADMSQSASLRPILAYLAWQVFLDHPLTGCGYRQYEEASDHYLSDHSTPLQLELGRRYVQHNVFLALLAETGMIGLGLFILLWVALLQASWQLCRAQVVPLEIRQQGLLMLVMSISYVVMAMFQDLTLIPMAHMLLFFLAGVTRNLQGQLSREGATPARSASERRLAPPVAVLVEQRLKIVCRGLLTPNVAACMAIMRRRTRGLGVNVSVFPPPATSPHARPLHGFRVHARLASLPDCRWWACSGSNKPMTSASPTPISKAAVSLTRSWRWNWISGRMSAREMQRNTPAENPRAQPTATCCPEPSACTPKYVQSAPNGQINENKHVDHGL